MLKRGLALIFLCMIAACQVPTLQPSLTASEATRIADAKARTFRSDIEYQHAPAQYDAGDDSWWIAYLQKGAKRPDFGVRVEAKTRKAWIVLR